MKGDFYNTIQEDDNALELSKKKAERQEDRILDYFQRHPFDSYTPFEIQHRVFGANGKVPITSVRRALTNLTDSGLLEKLEDFKLEVFGKRNHKWALANPTINNQLTLNF
jgi:Fe2+ or Zn2+ uptake regulation protein